MPTPVVTVANETADMTPIPNTGTWSVAPLNTSPRCFDLLCTGNCELGSSNQKLKLDIVPTNKIPSFFTKNSNGDIVFAEPKPVCTIRPPRGHSTAIEIELKTITSEYSDIAKYVCLGIRKKGSCEYLNILYAPKNAVGNPSGIFEILDNNEIELVPLISNADLSKSDYKTVITGEVISKSSIPFPANEFDFGSVYRVKVKVMDLTITWLENQPCDLQKLSTDDRHNWQNYGHLGVGVVRGKTNQLVAIHNDSGQLAYSSDGGATWSAWGNALGGNGWWAGPVYGNGTWCAVNFNKDEAYSKDKIRYRKDGAVSWSSTSMEFPGAINLNFDNGIFMFVGNDNNVYTSSNAENWNLVGSVPNTDTGHSGQMRILIFGNNMWICGTLDGEIFRSPDKTGAGKWISLGSNLNKIPHHEWEGGCFTRGYFYVIDNANCRVARSSDGINWIQIAELYRTSTHHSSVTLFNDKLYLFCVDGTHYHVGSFAN